MILGYRGLVDEVTINNVIIYQALQYLDFRSSSHNFCNEINSFMIDIAKQISNQQARSRETLIICIKMLPIPGAIDKSSEITAAYTTFSSWGGGGGFTPLQEFSSRDCDGRFFMPNTDGGLGGAVSPPVGPVPSPCGDAGGETLEALKILYFTLLKIV